MKTTNNERCYKKNEHKKCDRKNNTTQKNQHKKIAQHKNTTQKCLRMKCVTSLKIVHDDELFILYSFKNRLAANDKKKIFF